MRALLVIALYPLRYVEYATRPRAAEVRAASIHVTGRRRRAA